MEKPLVSVIIPNYCHAKYLDQRIQTVLCQTYRFFEVIILDDASCDNGASKAVIEKYRGNPHVSHIVYNDQNSGSTFIQWNKGFELAKGDLIWIAESDDYCELNFLETLIPCWEQHPECSIVQSSGYYAYPDQLKDCYNRGEKGTIDYYRGVECIKKHFVNSCHFIPNASAVLFRKDLAQTVPKDYQEYKSAGDRLFWIYMLERGSICHVNKQLNYFRQHVNKVSNKKEYDGTQCRENYRINRYLHHKGYLNMRLAADEYLFYRNYILIHEFNSEQTRKQLLDLWFPGIRQTRYYAKCVKLFVWLYDSLLGIS